MKKIILSVLILFLFINSNAQDRAQKIDELVSKYAEIGVFNGSVLVGENGNVFFEKGYGYADREQKLQNTFTLPMKLILPIQPAKYDFI